jgi:hypothetical protein
MKSCTKCKKVKDYSEFSKDSRKQDGLNCQCKSCRKIYLKKYYILNKERIDRRNLEYSRNNKETISKRGREWYLQNKEKMKAYQHTYYLNNIVKMKKKHQEWVQKNLKKIADKKRFKCKTEPLFKLKNTLRCRTNEAFRNMGFRKGTKTANLLGCSFEIIKNHLESQFKEKMTWKNHGEWHIDHIIPLASAKTEEEMIKLCHYTNLQPLWAEENFKKADFVPQNLAN